MVDDQDADAGQTQGDVQPVTATTPDGQSAPVDLKLDLSQIDEKVEKKVREVVQEVLQAIEEAKTLEKDEDGKGVVDDAQKEYLEEMQHIVEGWKSGDLKQRWIIDVFREAIIDEQWMKVIPATTTKEVSAHIRDYCFVSYVLRGKQGDTVNIPYVKDFDFQILTNVGDSFSDSLGTVYATTTATLKEAGGWTRVAYQDLEKIDANMMDEINQRFARAAIRAEDRIVMEALDDLTTSQFAGVIDRDTATAYFHASSIPAAIGKLLDAGKDAAPGEVTSYLTAGAYGALLEELAASQPAAFARPDILRSGRVTDYMGVRIVVGAKWFIGPPRSGGTGTGYGCCVGRYRRGVVLGPKRELLLETEKDTRTRTILLTGSHTIACKVVDGKEFVRVNTSEQTA